jgi:hypothetical protein
LAAELQQPSGVFSWVFRYDALQWRAPVLVDNSVFDVCVTFRPPFRFGFHHPPFLRTRGGLKAPCGARATQLIMTMGSILEITRAPAHGAAQMQVKLERPRELF